MARSARVHRRFPSHLRYAPYPLPSYHRRIQEKDGKTKRQINTIKKDWEDATCSVCMEFPHNAVLLLCSSHDKGCRPYMCGTSHRFSNCLDQFKKAYMKAEEQNIGTGIPNLSGGRKSEVVELACPLCRGQVKGWTVVEPARQCLDAKKRSCMQDNCSFAGTYKELRKHVKAKHPSAKPRVVDPVLEQKWRSLQHERDREDVISTIRSSMPGAMVLGDYVIENGLGDYVIENGLGDYVIENDGDYDSEEEEENHLADGRRGRGRIDDNWFNFLFLLQSFGNSRDPGFSSRIRRPQRSYRLVDSEVGRSAVGPSLDSGGAGLPLHSTSEGENIDDDGSTFIGLGRGVGAERTGRRRRRRNVGGRG